MTFNIENQEPLTMRADDSETDPLTNRKSVELPVKSSARVDPLEESESGELAVMSSARLDSLGEAESVDPPATSSARVNYPSEQKKQTCEVYMGCGMVLCTMWALFYIINTHNDKFNFNI